MKKEAKNKNNKIDYTYEHRGKKFIVGADLPKENKNDESVEYYLNVSSNLTMLLRNEN